MKNHKASGKITLLLTFSILATTFHSCQPETKEVKNGAPNTEQPEYFLLRP